MISGLNISQDNRDNLALEDMLSSVRNIIVLLPHFDFDGTTTLQALGVVCSGLRVLQVEDLGLAALAIFDTEFSALECLMQEVSRLAHSHSHIEADSPLF